MYASSLFSSSQNHLRLTFSSQSANVDWALLNFMKDWFPIESRKKLRQNEKEVAQEEMEELGLDVSCIIA